MNFYPENYIVEVTVPFTDVNDTAIVPTAISAVLNDGDGVLVTNIGVVSFVLADGQVTISIGAAFNQLVSEPREARVLKVLMTTAQGVVAKSFSYVIEAEQTLQIMNNTFLTLENAEIMAIDNVNFTGWQTGDDESKRAALSEAFRNITRISMKYSPLDDMGVPISSEIKIITRQTWPDVTANEFLVDFPSHFRRSLRQAQMAEANEILNGNEISRRHASGIISETIGESSVTLKQNLVNYGLSSAAIGILGSYIYINNRLARA